MLKLIATLLACVFVSLITSYPLLTNYRVNASEQRIYDHELRPVTTATPPVSNNLLDELVQAQIWAEQRKQTERQLEHCRQFQPDFELAAKLTAQDVNVLLAVATIESGGCRNFGKHRAKGMMQIAFPDLRHTTRAAQLLKLVSAEQLDYANDHQHNLVLGAVMLQDYTRRFGNLPDGLEAYNQGPSKVEIGDHSAYPSYVIRVLAVAELAKR